MSSIWHASPSRSHGSRKFAARSLQSRWRRAPAIAGCAIGGACLVWLARQVSLEQALASVRGLDRSIVALAVAADIGAYIIQGWRWSLLLRPVKRASWLATTEAIYVGLFANEILPLRTGEIIRAYALSRSLRVSVSSIVPSILVERLFDGIWLGIGVSVTALLVPLPVALRQAADIFAGTILIATSAFAVMVFRSSASASTPPAPPGTFDVVGSGEERRAGGRRRDSPDRAHADDARRSGGVAAISRQPGARVLACDARMRLESVSVGCGRRAPDSSPRQRAAECACQRRYVSDVHRGWAGHLWRREGGGDTILDGTLPRANDSALGFGRHGCRPQRSFASGTAQRRRG